MREIFSFFAADKEQGQSYVMTGHSGGETRGGSDEAGGSDKIGYGSDG